MYIVYMAGRPPRQKAKNDARQQLCTLVQSTEESSPSSNVWRSNGTPVQETQIMKGSH